MELVTNKQVTMSSVELVAVINELREEGQSELLHKNFIVKIENHPGINSAEFLAQYKDSTGRTLKCYQLPKRECELMVMSESLAVQAKVYDRMAALEKQLLQGRAEVAPPLDTAVKAAKTFTGFFRVARLIGLDKNASAISANQAVLQLTGTNMLTLLGQTHLESEKQELVFNVSDLSEGISGVKMNRMLMAAGMQTNEDGRWIRTELGKKFSRLFDTGKRHGNGTPVQQLKWFREVLNELSIGEAA